MKFLNKFSLLSIFIFALTSCGVSIQDPDNSSNNFTRDIEVRVNGVDNIIAGVYEYAENGFYYILTESRLGFALTNAYFVLENGSKQLIEDIKEFAITNNIIAIEVNFEPGVALEGFTLNSNSYNGYYLGNPYYINLKSTPIPLNATNPKIRYFSSKPNIVSVSNSGVLMVKGVGNVLISAVSLEGNYKQTLQMTIKDGQATLKDSVVNNDLTENTIVGDRYDENSGQSSVFNGVTFNSNKSEIITVGKAQYNNQQNIALISKFGAKQGSTNSSLNMDSKNEFYSEELLDVDYDLESTNYFAVGNLAETSSSKNSGLVVKFKENTLFSPSRLQLEKVQRYSYVGSDITNSDAFFTGVQVNNGFVFISGYLRFYKTEFLIPVEWRASFIMVYDLDLNLERVIWFNNYVESAVGLTSMSINEFNDNILLSGFTNTNATFIAEISFEESKTNVIVGYYSNIENAQINDVIAISETDYVAVGNGIINRKEVSFITTFGLINGEFQSFNSVKNEFFNATYANKVFSTNGIITVIGYAKENVFLNTKEYATLSNYDYSLQYLSGKIFFNGRADVFSNKGHKQIFYDAVIDDFNLIVGVGASNYNFTNQYNGYIQYNVTVI